MNDASPDRPLLPKTSALRWEIGAAIGIKLLLLAGLWFFIFRWQERPAAKPDIAAHLALPAAAQPFSSQPVKESDHVR